jgi:hypothetical protein
VNDFSGYQLRHTATLDFDPAVTPLMSREHFGVYRNFFSFKYYPSWTLNMSYFGYGPSVILGFCKHSSNLDLFRSSNTVVSAYFGPLDVFPMTRPLDGAFTNG